MQSNYSIRNSARGIGEKKPAQQSLPVVASKASAITAVSSSASQASEPLIVEFDFVGSGMAEECLKDFDQFNGLFDVPNKQEWRQMHCPYDLNDESVFNFNNMMEVHSISTSELFGYDAKGNKYLTKEGAEKAALALYCTYEKSLRFYNLNSETQNLIKQLIYNGDNKRDVKSYRNAWIILTYHSKHPQINTDDLSTAVKYLLYLQQNNISITIADESIATAKNISDNLSLCGALLHFLSKTEAGKNASSTSTTTQATSACVQLGQPIDVKTIVLRMMEEEAGRGFISRIFTEVMELFSSMISFLGIDVENFAKGILNGINPKNPNSHQECQAKAKQVLDMLLNLRSIKKLERELFDITPSNADKTKKLNLLEHRKEKFASKIKGLPKIAENSTSSRSTSSTTKHTSFVPEQQRISVKTSLVSQEFMKDNRGVLFFNSMFDEIMQSLTDVVQGARFSSIILAMNYITDGITAKSSSVDFYDQCDHSVEKILDKLSELPDGHEALPPAEQQTTGQFIASPSTYNQPPAANQFLDWSSGKLITTPIATPQPQQFMEQCPQGEYQTRQSNAANMTQCTSINTSITSSAYLLFSSSSSSTATAATRTAKPNEQCVLQVAPSQPKTNIGSFSELEKLFNCGADQDLRNGLYYIVVDRSGNISANRMQKLAEAYIKCGKNKLFVNIARKVDIKKTQHNCFAENEFDTLANALLCFGNNVKKDQEHFCANFLQLFNAQENSFGTQGARLAACAHPFDFASNPAVVFETSKKQIAEAQSLRRQRTVAAQSSSSNGQKHQF